MSESGEPKSRRGPGRPPLPPEVKRARRNARERKRREMQRDAKGLPDIPVSPFARGFDLLEAMEGPGRNTGEPGTQIAVAGQILPHALTPVQMERARTITEGLRKYQVTGLAPNSLRAMRVDWRQWLAYCLESDLPLLPATGDALIQFVDRLQDAGYRRASIEHMVFTVRYMSRLYDCPDPTTDPVYHAFWKDLCRTRLSATQKQAPGLNLPVLDAMVANADLGNRAACRDAAMVSLLYDGLLRASEVVDLTWENLSARDARGGATVLIARSKSDQEGKGREVYLSPATVALLERWRGHADPTCPYIFHAVVQGAFPKGQTRPTGGWKPMAPTVVGQALRRRAAGVVDIDYTGHSGRVGATQDMTEWGHSMPEIMQIGGWSGPEMPARYARQLNAANVGRERFARAERARKRHRSLTEDDV